MATPARSLRAKRFYAQCPTTRISPPTLVSSWITVENVGALLSEQRFGWTSTCCRWIWTATDYWIWQALPDLRPRVVVLEFNALLGPHESLSLPYDPKFQLDLSKPPYKCGASLTAFYKAGRFARLPARRTAVARIQCVFRARRPAPAGLPALTPEACFTRTERLRGWSQSWFDMMIEGGQQWDSV
jgi:hypothetical protein